MTPDLDKINKEGMERAQRAKHSFMSSPNANLQEILKWRHEMFPYELRPTPDLPSLNITWDEVQSLYFITLPFGEFITAIDDTQEVLKAIQEPRRFYEMVTGKEWPFDKSPVSIPNLDDLLEELF